VQSDDFFWGRFTMRKALIMGAGFASHQKDTSRASKYAAVADEITKGLSSHVQSNGFVCEASTRCQDSAVIEAFNVGYNDDGVFAPLQKEVIATLSGLSKVFCKDFVVNQEAAAAGTPGVLFGRYSGDNYDGGNPWILLSASAATLLYRQSQEVSHGKMPDAVASAMFEDLLGGKVTASSLLGAGDAILLRMKAFLKNGMHMNEQIDRNDGTLKSAKDLTWNYANILKAMMERSKAENAVAKTLIV